MTSSTPTKRGRGAQAKRPLEDDAANNASAPPAKKRPGRPKGSTNAATLAHPEPELGPITSPRRRKAANHAVDAIATTLSPQRSRGRPKKAAPAITETAAAKPKSTTSTGPKRRGRPPKSESTTSKPAGRVAKPAASPTKHRGRPAKVKTEAAAPAKPATKTKPTKTSTATKKPAPAPAPPQNKNTVTIDKKKLKAILDRLSELESRVGRLEEEAEITDLLTDPAAVLDELNGDIDDEEAETEIEVDILPTNGFMSVENGDDVQVLATQENGHADGGSNVVDVEEDGDDVDVEDIRASLGPVDYDATIGGGRANGVGAGADGTLQNPQVDGANDDDGEGILGAINPAAESLFANVIRRFGGASPER